MILPVEFVKNLNKSLKLMNYKEENEFYVKISQMWWKWVTKKKINEWVYKCIFLMKESKGIPHSMFYKY